MMNKKILTAILLSAPLMAINYQDQIGLGINGGYNFAVGGNDLNNQTDNDYNWGIHARYHLCQKNGLELGYTQYKFDKKDNANIYNKASALDVLFFHRYLGTANLTPVAGLGLGVVDTDNYSPSSLKLGFKVRLGAEYTITKNLSAGLYADYQQINKMVGATNTPEGTGYVISPKASLTWYFGKAEEVAENVTEMVKSSDADNDGIDDKNDKCANSPKGTAVNEYGCTKEEKASITLNVKFNSGKNTIQNKYQAQIGELAAFLEKYPKTTATIEGYTDNTGSDATNLKLSETRALSIKNALISNYKIDASRLTSKGFGSANPIADNNTAEGKEENRRVIAVIAE
jgi:OOP family OmpA-OmpF porin